MKPTLYVSNAGTFGDDTETAVNVDGAGQWKREPVQRRERRGVSSVSAADELAALGHHASHFLAHDVFG